VKAPAVDLERAARLLRDAAHVVALTGAGVSAESGVPTFRDAQTGLWARYRPEDLATPEAFERDPKLVWEWYAMRRSLVARARPNPAHIALAAIEARARRFTLVTQNVDDLHRRAGTRELIELHGNIARSKCAREGVVVESWAPGDEVPPRCPRCGARLRPDVVWFGEMLPPQAYARAEAAARSCDLFLSVGTSSLVYPAAALPEIAKRSGAALIEVNPQATPLTPSADVALRGAAGELLPGLVALAWPESEAR
jgi:NAD-dependent deacetylase